MKKITPLLVAVIVTLSFSSCKKEYECNCTSVNTTVYEALDSDVDDDYIDEMNDDAEKSDKKTEMSESFTSDKTTKAGIAASCPPTSESVSYTVEDYNYYYYDAFYDDYFLVTEEDAIGVTVTTKTTCSAK